MKKLLLYLWQLPQNILGLILIFFTKADEYTTIGRYWKAEGKFYFGICLGNYIIFQIPDCYYWQLPLVKSIKHENGHQKQSKYLGWFYLLIIGIPSFLFNVFDRLFHNKWNTEKRMKWYYSLPWEKWADKLGGVRRFSE